MLNPKLHAVLQKLFKEVVIHSEDKPADTIRFVQGSVMSSNKIKPYFRPKGGEQYGIMCPFCKRRDKLYVSYAYGSKMAPSPGAPLVPCAKNVFSCYTCEFEKKNKENRNKFIKLLDTGVSGDIVIDLEAQSEKRAVVRRPEEHFPVSVPLSAPEAISGRLYMESRNYDVNDLITNWGALYSADPRYFRAPYLVFPIFCHGRLVTWQARYIGGDNDIRGLPKYYFDPDGFKNEVLYNMDRVRHSKLGVLVEGIPACIRIGARHGVASFGKFPSRRQVKLLRAMFGEDGILVVMLDHDAIERTRELINGWRSSGYFNTLYNIDMPDDRDPGDYTTEAVWTMIRQHVKELQ